MCGVFLRVTSCPLWFKIVLSQPEQPSGHTVAIRFLLMRPIHNFITTKGTKFHEGIHCVAFPSCDFMPFVVQGVHSFSSRIIFRYGRNWRRFSISATERPFSN